MDDRVVIRAVITGSAFNFLACLDLDSSPIPPDPAAVALIVVIVAAAVFHSSHNTSSTRYMAPRPLSHALVLALFRAVSKLHSAYAYPSLRRGTVDLNNGYPLYAFMKGDEPSEEPGSVGFWSQLFISIGLVLAGGVFAGYVERSAYMVHPELFY